MEGVKTEGQKDTDCEGDTDNKTQRETWGRTYMEVTKGKEEMVK